MASDLEKFNRNIVGNKKTIVDYIPLISSSGDFSKSYNLNAILNSWNNILLTQTRSYVGNPEYGSNLYKYVFDPADEVTESAIKDEIRYRLMLYDNRALITNINITFLQDGHGYKIDLNVEYENENASMTTVIHKDLIKLDI